MLADIAQLQRRRLAELLLQGKVPLLVLRRPQVLIRDSDPLCRRRNAGHGIEGGVASKINRWARRR